MPARTLEERVVDLEVNMARLLGDTEKPEQERWWHRHFGVFQDDPTFDEATRLGKEYRKAQPNAADNPEAIEL